MGNPRSKEKAREKNEGLDKQLNDSAEPAKRLTKRLPTPEKVDPRSSVQPSKQKHPPRAPGP
jgi:hypothetical protein